MYLPFGQGVADVSATPSLNLNHVRDERGGVGRTPFH